MNRSMFATSNDLDRSPIEEPEPAKARISDPATSHAAANAISPERMRDAYKAIVEALGVHGPMTDEEILHWVLAGTQSTSGLRTRRNELCKKGFVIDAGWKKRLQSRLFGNVWKLTGAGGILYAELTGLAPYLPWSERKHEQEQETF